MKMFWKKFKVKQNAEPEIYPFTKWSTFGNHLYRTENEDPRVEFVNKETGERKLIVDYFGRIHNFPGIIREECWVEHYKSKNKLVSPVIRFRTDFERYDDEKYIMIWEIQPDGEYWSDDDGYGMKNDEEIRLYAFIDENGDFITPFRVYNVGNVSYLKR